MSDTMVTTSLVLLIGLWIAVLAYTDETADEQLERLRAERDEAEGDEWND